MSNRLFQGIIHQMKDAVDRIIGVIDENGVIISCSELVRIGETCQGIRDEIAYTSTPSPPEDIPTARSATAQNRSTSSSSRARTRWQRRSP